MALLKWQKSHPKTHQEIKHHGITSMCYTICCCCPNTEYSAKVSLLLQSHPSGLHSTHQQLYQAGGRLRPVGTMAMNVKLPRTLLSNVPQGFCSKKTRQTIFAIVVSNFEHPVVPNNAWKTRKLDGRLYKKYKENSTSKTGMTLCTCQWCTMSRPNTAYWQLSFKHLRMQKTQGTIEPRLSIGNLLPLLHYVLPGWVHVIRGVYVPVPSVKPYWTWHCIHI
jgi:hypothetical protein